MSYGIIALLGYLFGCSNMAWFLARRRGFDIRSHGSGNAGASNAAVTMGMKAGVLVAVHDVAKSLLAAILAGLLFPALPHAAVVAGIGAVLGHIFPAHMRFRGGKGLAPFMGMVLALDWKCFLVIVLAIALVTLITDYIVLGTFTAITAFPAYLFWQNRLLPAAMICTLSAVILYKHRINIKRLATGQEIGLRRTLQKKDQVK